MKRLLAVDKPPTCTGEWLMPPGAPSLTPTVIPPPLTRVTCPTCRAPQGSRCSTTTTRLPVPDGHRPRWDRYHRETRERLSRWLLLEDDEQFGLRAGDVLIGRPYWLDPGMKITVEYREGDGFDPSCNQYYRAVRWIGWADE
jgi:hypothetical protein